MTSPDASDKGAGDGVEPPTQSSNAKGPHGIKTLFLHPQVFAAVIGGVFALLLAVLKITNDRADERQRRELETVRDSARGQVEVTEKEKESLDRAMDLLASPNEQQVSAGISLLTELAQAARLHRSIYDRLVGFVKNRVPRRGACPTSPSQPPSVNVQSALTLIGSLRARTPGMPLELADRHLERVKLPGADLRGADLSGTCLDSARLDSAHLDRARLRGAVLSHASFVGASLDAADLSLVRASRAVFNRATLRGAMLDSADLDNASFVDATLSHARLTGAHGLRALFVRAKLVGADFEDARLQKAQFRAADMRCARLLNAHLDSAEFSDAALPWAYFGGARLPHVFHWMEVKNFEGAYLFEADLLSPNLLQHAGDRGAYVKPLGSAEWDTIRTRKKGCPQ